jgi:hypothetical protein
MSEWKEDEPFEVLVLEPESDQLADLTRRQMARVEEPSDPPTQPPAATARLYGFDLDERPLLTGLPGLLYEIVPARTTVSLLRCEIGCAVVVLFEQGDVRRPIVLGVLRDSRSTLPAAPVPEALVTAQVDDQKVVLSAEREIVLQCGEASITLTRAGKVLIKGTYVLSRSSGYNRIKGAAIDIN